MKRQVVEEEEEEEEGEEEEKEEDYLYEVNDVFSKERVDPQSIDAYSLFPHFSFGEQTRQFI